MDLQKLGVPGPSLVRKMLAACPLDLLQIEQMHRQLLTCTYGHSGPNVAIFSSYSDLHFVSDASWEGSWDECCRRKQANSNVLISSWDSEFG